MNILFIAHESRLGGANLSMLGMIDEMAKKHQISVVVPIKRGFVVDELRKRKIPVYYRHSFWWMLAPAETPGKTFLKKVIYKVLCCNNYLCALSLKSVVRKRKIDIIHTNSSVINTGGILSRMTGVPHVWHIREFALKGLGFFSVWDYRKLCDFIDSHSDKVVTISRAIAQEFEDKISPDKLKVVYNGVSDKNNQQKSDVKESGSRVEYLISGRNNPEKGLDEAIRAVGILVEEGYQNLHLSMAGTEVADNLEQLITECRVRDYISYLGMVKDMPAVKKLSEDVGIPADLKEIVKPEDVQFLAESAFADAWSRYGRNAGIDTGRRERVFVSQRGRERSGSEDENLSGSPREDQGAWG